MRIINKIVKMIKMFKLRKKYNMSKSGSYMLSSLFFKEIKSKKYPKPYIKTAHRYGFSVDDWRFLGLNKDNYKDYLSTASYFAMHPINGSYSFWIDDKLTLKYLCSGTPLQEFMPKYYYQIDSMGRIIPLMDNEIGGGTIESVILTLKDKKVLAIKLIAGSIGEGFIKAEYCNGIYCFNGKQMSEQEAIARIMSLKNYLITEYLFPHEEFEKYCSNTCNTIRYLQGKVDGNMMFLKSFVRFGTIQSKFVENFNCGGVLCYVDSQGNYNGGYKLNFDDRSTEKINEHPDSKELLVGAIPRWETIVKVANLFGEVFPQLNYLGIDFVVCNDGSVKVLEINSLTSLDSLQLDGSILKTSAGVFYKELSAKG